MQNAQDLVSAFYTNRESNFVHREIFYDFFYVKKSGLWLTGESSRDE